MQTKTIAGIPADPSYISQLGRALSEVLTAEALFDLDELEAYTAEYIQGRFHGPRVPTIGFWYGEKFLGEVRFVDGANLYEKISNAKQTLSRQLDMLEEGDRRGIKQRMLYSVTSSYKIYH